MEKKPFPTTIDELEVYPQQLFTVLCGKLIPSAEPKRPTDATQPPERFPPPRHHQPCVPYAMDFSFALWGLLQ